MNSRSLCMARHPIGKQLTRLGELGAHPLAFLIVVVYAALWFVFERGTFDWHAVATLATWLMTLFITRSEHRDNQAVQAKLDEVLKTLGKSNPGLLDLDDREPEEIEQHRHERRSRG